MKKKHRTNFLLGAAFGALICVIVWYWQKSTAADEAALNLLDRLAETQTKLRPYTETADFIPQSAKTEPATHPPFEWERINGIGPTYATRLREAGIVALPDLAHADPDHIREITRLQPWHVHNPQDWIDEARRLLNE
ncbi:MAG: helix-hairpin-helix domain-containing protein [Chloroflexota bacterium]|jgi:predicted flap endonuclease-1-like 5' DNA nuclease